MKYSLFIQVFLVKEKNLLSLFDILEMVLN